MSMFEFREAVVRLLKVAVVSLVAIAATLFAGAFLAAAMVMLTLSI